jgi:D-alanyl-D-alanine dipeptidase
LGKKLNTYTGGQDYLDYLKNHKGTFSHMSHASGNAVDIVGIIDDQNKKLNMGGQTNTVKDKIDYYNKSKMPKEIIIKNNRKLLNDVLTKNQFENFKDEWWHWGFYG